MKASELYDEVVVLINYLIEKIDSANDKYLVLRTLITMQTSCLRLINQPEKAIEFYNELYGIYGGSIGSSALYTSIAAAYCDIDDIDSAVKNVNRAHAISKGNSSLELISVYARIKAMRKKI